MTRQQFILWHTIGYVIMGSAWILVSDQMTAGFTDTASMTWIGTIKGIAFILVSALFFYFTVKALPAARDGTSDPPHTAVEAMASPATRLKPPTAYLLAAAATLLTALADRAASGFLHDRPVFLVFMLPILVSAMAGGLGPGLLSTLMACGFLTFGVPPDHAALPLQQGDPLRFVLLIANGLAVSLMSEALRRSRARAQAGWRLLNMVVSSTSDAIFVKDEKGRYLLSNEATARLMGKSPEQLIGQTAATLLDAESAGRINESDRAIMESGRLETDEITLRDATGRTITLLATTGPLLNENGRVSGMFGIARDITERVRTERALRESEGDYRSLFENMLEGFALCRMRTTDPLDFVYLSVNPAFAALTGLHDVVGKWVSDIIPDIRETNADLLQAYRRVATGGPPERLESYVPGLGIWFSIAVYSPRPEHFVAIFDNITDRKRTEKRLDTERGSLRNIISNLPDLVWLKDPEGVYLACNPEFERFFGAAEADIVGKTDYDFVDRSLADFFREKDRKAIAAGGPSTNEEWVIYASDGRRVLLETIKTPLQDAGGHLIGVLGVGRDITQRHEASERLKLQGAALEAAANAIVITDPDGSIEWVNRAFTDMTGYTAEEAIGHNPREILKSGFHDQSEYQALWQTITEGRVWHGELINRRKDGTTYNEDQTITPVRDEHGAIRHFVAIKQDVTERFQAEQAAMESELQIVSIIDSLGSPLALIDQSGTILRVNRAWNVTYENPHSRTVEAVGRNYFDDLRDRISADEALHVTDGLRSVMRASIPYLSAEVPITTRQGKRWILLRAYPIRGQTMSLVAVHDDITERKATEEALAEAHRHLQAHKEHLEELVEERTAELREAEARTRLIVDSSAAGLFGIDADGCFAFVNPAACTMLGYTADALVGKPVHETIHHTRPDGTPCPVSECPIAIAIRRAETISNARDFFWRSDGTSVPVAYASRPISDGDRRAGAVVSFMDMTAQMQAEAARETALREAERLAAARSDFLANMSHEIRTPLNAVIGFAQIGRRESAGRKSSATFERILDAGQFLLGLINDILDVTKIEAGKLIIEEGTIRIGPLLNQSVSIVTERARNKGVAVMLHRSTDLPPICRGDPLRVSQILLNLLSNAVKFTKAGHVSLSASRQGDRLIFEVEDTGIGMTQEQLERLFRPFEQADTSTTRQFGGTGLGLTISQRLARMMGGEIRVSSQMGVGSRFVLDLPLQEMPPGALASELTDGSQASFESRPEGQARLAGVSILSAEDNEVNRMVLEEMVVREGANLVQVQNGREAVDEVAKRGAQAFDIVLMDIQMPVMDGYEATHLLSAAAPGLPILGLTAHAFSEERDRCLSAGMVDHLAKPIDLDRLVALILHYTGREAGDTPVERSPESQAVRSAGPGQAFDIQALEERYRDRAAFLTRLLQAILSSNAAVPEQLRAAATSVDYEQIAFLAHCAKGMSANIFAVKVNEMARRTESAARERQAASPELALELAAAVDELLTLVSERTQTTNEPGQEGGQ